MSLPKRPGIDFKIPRIDLVIILLLACLMVSTPALPDEETGVAALPPDHGYILIRVDVNQRERIQILTFKNIDTQWSKRLDDNFSRAWRPIFLERV
jgi:hypothetical protein